MTVHAEGPSFPRKGVSHIYMMRGCVKFFRKAMTGEMDQRPKGFTFELNIDGQRIEMRHVIGDTVENF